MIPPTSDIRLRSIRRWMKDQTPQQFAQLSQSGELDIAIVEKDELMDQAFEEAESELMTRLDRSGRWGTQEGMQEFHMLRLMAWQEICQRFLPVLISAQDQET